VSSGSEGAPEGARSSETGRAARLGQRSLTIHRTDVAGGVHKATRPDSAGWLRRAPEEERGERSLSERKVSRPVRTHLFAAWGVGDTATPVPAGEGDPHSS
jgi:hypothetical protein